MKIGFWLLEADDSAVASKFALYYVKHILELKEERGLYRAE